MTSPWALIASGGVTLGALFGLPGAVLWSLSVAVATSLGGRRWVALTLVAATAAAIGLVRVAGEQVPIPPRDVLASSRAEVEVRSVPQSGPSGPRAVVRVERVQGGEGEWIGVGGDVLVLFRDHAPDDLARGDRLRLVWSVTSSEELDAGFGRFVRSSGAGASASAFHVDVLERGDSATTALVRFRDTITECIQDAVPGDRGALLAGFVTGDDSGLSESTREAFERTNLSHITAVSGSNVAVLVTMWLFLVPTQRLRRSLPALLAIALAIWLYVMLVGMGPGAVRAGLFATVMLPAARMGRRPDPLTALMLASAVMLLARPGFADNAGYWLSLAASTAMVTCLAGRQTTRAGVVVSGVIALVVAQVATLPITVWVFGGWSPASLIANLVVGPVVAVFFPFAFIAALLMTAAPWIGELVGWLPAIVANVIIAVVRSLAGDFSLIGTGGVPVVGIVLIGVLSLAVIGALSGDVHRWLKRVEWERPGLAGVAAPVALGTAAGVWIAALALALAR